MFGFLPRKRRLRATGIRTIPIGELAALWRKPDESDANSRGVESRETKVPESRKAESADRKAASPTSPATGPELDPSNRDDAWYDETRLLDALKRLLAAGTPSAFVYRQKAYYSLDAVSEALNAQREEHTLEPLDPGSVIEFFKAGRGLDSGKYVMRFETGLPVKIYLYSHPADGRKESVRHRPLDESGCRLKSLKLIKGPTP